MGRWSAKLGGRAAIAVALLAGFYVLAAAVLVGILAVNVALLRATGRVSSQLVLFSIVSVVAVLHGVLSLERRRGAALPGLEVRRDEHPDLWELVEALSTEMGTDPPHDLRVVDGADAYVGEVGGLLGLRRGRRLMAVGLALVQVLTVDQLRAVLAHELGHYAGGDTRLGAVNYRGAASLGRTIDSLGSDSLLGRLFSSYARLFFRVSSAVRRRQELTADAAAVQIGGRRAHVEALQTVGVAAAVYSHLLDSFVAPLWDRGLRPEDLYSGFRSLWSEPERARDLDDVAQMLLDRSASPYDSHPSVAERIANAQLVPDGGGRGDTRSARELFTDVCALERRLTDELSTRVLGDASGPALPWDDLAEALVTPNVAMRAVELLDVVAQIDGGPSPASLGRLLAVLRVDDVIRLAVGFGGDLAGVPQDERAEQQVRLLEDAVMATVACALVDAGTARWRLSWAHDFELVDGDGDLVPLRERVGPVLDEPQRLAALHEWLRTAGPALDWTPQAPPRAWRAPRVADSMVAWLNGVTHRRRGAEVLVLTDELVIARRRRSGTERLWAAAAAYSMRSGPSRETVTRVRELLEQSVDVIAQADGLNRRLPWTAIAAARLRRRPGGWLLVLVLSDGEVVRLSAGVTSPPRARVAEILRPFLGERLHA